MNSQQKPEYCQHITETVRAAGLVLVEIIPEEMYVETICPECRRTLSFFGEQVDTLRCEWCYKKHGQEKFIERCERLVTAAGLIFQAADFEEDYVEFECPKCGSISSCYSKELKSVCCIDCTIKNIAHMNGYELLFEEEVQELGLEYSYELNQQKTANGERLVVLECGNCDIGQIVVINQQNAIERIKGYECKCRAVTRQLEWMAGEYQRSGGTSYAALIQGLQPYIVNLCNDGKIIIDPFHGKVFGTNTMVEKTVDGTVCRVYAYGEGQAIAFAKLMRDKHQFEKPSARQGNAEKKIN